MDKAKRTEQQTEIDISIELLQMAESADNPLPDDDTSILFDEKEESK